MSHAAPGRHQLSLGVVSGLGEQLSQGISRRRNQDLDNWCALAVLGLQPLGLAQQLHASAIGQAVAVQDAAIGLADDPAACLPVGSPWHYLSFPRTSTELLDKTWSPSALSHTQPFLP